MNVKLNKIQNWTELARQANWSVFELAKRCGVCEETLRRHFLKYVGKSPRVWLAEDRQSQAIKLLSAGSSIKETASSLGYKQQTNFTRKFKQHWGACPSLQVVVQPVSHQSLPK